MGAIYHSTFEVEAGRTVRFRTVACRCGAEGRWRDTTRNGAPAEMIEKGLRRQGWTRLSPGGGVCPTCQAAAKPKPIKEPAMTAVEAPRTPTPDDKRRIREELFAHYLEDKGCWSGAHSDRSVAATLKVPFAWVSQMRDALGFGPDVNESGTAWRTEIDALKADILAAQDRILTEAAAVAETLSQRLAKLERAGPK